MAISPHTNYSAQTDVDGTNYPLGKARNVSSASAGDGTPLEKAWVNDLWGFEQALLAAAGITASGSPDTAAASQYLQAMQALFASKHNYIVGAGQATYAGGLSASSSSTTPLFVGGSGFNLSPATQAGDIVEIEIGPISISQAVNAPGGSLKVYLSENTGAVLDTSTEFVLPDNVIRSLTIPISYTCTVSGVFGVQLFIIGDGSHAVSMSTLNCPRFATYRIIRP